MFNMINFAFNINLTMQQKRLILNAILPLSDRVPSIKMIKVYVQKIDNKFYEETKVDREKFETFLTNYLFNNIGNMVWCGF